MRPAYHFVYLSEIDISIDNGRGINEREFVRCLLEEFADEVTCILPEAEKPAFRDPRIEYVPGHSSSGLRYGIHLLSAYCRLRTVHARRPVNGLVTRLGVAPLLPLLARERLGIPTILKTLVAYEFNHQVFSAMRFPKPHRIVSWLFSPMLRSVIERCAMADTVGESVAEWTRAQYRIPDGRLVVIPNGANTDLFVPGDRLEVRRALGLDRSATLFGYIGIMAPERNLERLIEDFAALDSRDARLLMVGEGPLRRELEGLARRLGVADRVLFRNQIDYGAVPAVASALDVGIDLSLLRFRSPDGRLIPVSFSQKLAQYLATAVPVLAWDLPETRFIEQQNVGRLAAVERPETLRKALQEFLHLSSTSREEMRLRARRVAEENLSVRELVRKRVSLWKASVGLSGLRGRHDRPPAGGHRHPSAVH